MEYLVCARHCAKTFAWICSFNIHNSVRYLLLFHSHFRDKETESQKSLKNLLKGTELVSGSATN